MLSLDAANPGCAGSFSRPTKPSTIWIDASCAVPQDTRCWAVAGPEPELSESARRSPGQCSRQHTGQHDQSLPDAAGTSCPAPQPVIVSGQMPSCSRQERLASNRLLPGMAVVWWSTMMLEADDMDTCTL